MVANIFGMTPPAGTQPHAGVHRSLRDRPIEQPSIDHVRFDRWRGVGNLEAGRRDKLRRRQRVQNGGTGQVEFAERVVGEHPGAVHGLTDLVVLLEQRDIEAGAGKEGRRVKSTRSASDDRNVQHLLGCLFQMWTEPVHYRGHRWLIRAIRIFARALPSVHGM